MDSEAWKRYLLVAFVTLISIGGVAFGTYLLLEVFSTPLDRAMGVVFLFLLSINAVFNLSGGYYFLHSFSVPSPKPIPLKRFPTVAVVIPFRNEKAGVVQRTLEPLLRLDYPREKYRVYALDNSTVPDKSVREFCELSGVTYTHMENPVKLKAYVMNEFVRGMKEEYLAIFDADDVLFDPSFLKENLGYLEEDRSLASIQCQKEYAPSTFFANMINAYYSFFFRFIQPVRSVDKSGMFCGSVGIIRASVAKKVLFPHSPTEDTAFSFEADLQGHGGLFIPKVYAYGEPITKFSDFLAQQWRYTVGNTWLIHAFLQNLSRFPSWKKRMHYATQVFSFAYLSYLFILYALLTLSFVILNLATTLLYGSFAVSETAKWISITYSLAVVVMTVAGAKLYFGSYRLGLSVLFVNFSVALMRAKAVFYGLLRIPSRFVMTRQSPDRLTWAEAFRMTRAETLFALVLVAFAALSLANNDIVSGFWLTWYAVFFSSSLSFAVQTDVRARI